MAIGKYKPDGNIYSVPEVKEFLDGGGDDISELERKVNKNTDDISTLNGEVNEINTKIDELDIDTVTARLDGVDDSISTINDSIDTVNGDIATLTETTNGLSSTIGELQTDVTNIETDVSDVKKVIPTTATENNKLATNNDLGEKVGLIRGLFTSSNLTVAGYITNNSKSIEFLIPTERIPVGITSVINSLSIIPRFVSGTGYYHSGSAHYHMSTSAPTIIVEDDTAITGVASIQKNLKSTGFIIKINFNEQLTTDINATTPILNNTPVSLVVNFNITIS